VAGLHCTKRQSCSKCINSYLSVCTGRGAEYCDQPVCLSVCLSTSVSLEPLDQSSRNLLCRSPVVMAQSCSGGVAIHYVLPVLLMMSCLAVADRMAMRGLSITKYSTPSGTARPGLCLTSYECLDLSLEVYGIPRSGEFLHFKRTID